MRRFVCDNCDKTFERCREFLPLEEAKYLAARLDPGSVVPDGVCPECDCFVYAMRLEASWVPKGSLVEEGDLIPVEDEPESGQALPGGSWIPVPMLWVGMPNTGDSPVLRIRWVMPTVRP